MRLSNRQFNLLALTALTAIAAHLSRLPLWLSVTLVLIAPMRMATRARTGKPISAWLRVPLVFLLVAMIIVQYGNLFGREPGSALACGLLMLKLLESERVRDARAATAFAAFVLMSALLFTQTMAFTLVVCTSLVLLLATLNALEPAPLPAPHRLRAELRTGALLLGAGLPLAVAAFLFIPRLGSPLWGAPGNLAETRTGLDDRMSPGSMSELLIDDSPALRVRFDDSLPAPAARYFRALVLWDFDGSTWTRGRPRAGTPAESLAASTTPVDYEITMEPTLQPWLLALDVPVRAPDEATMRSDRTLAARSRVSQLRQYRLRSVLEYRLGGELESGDRQRALKLPAGFNPKTLALAKQWREQGDDDEAVVSNALAMFNASFTYTLSAPLLGRNSVDDFLFETRAGYCEHYSSAFVFLMRAAGIPARVVTGYQGGWWNGLGNYLLVRNSDAHAWSEVWLAGRGWVRIDPTAAVSPIRIESGAAAANGSDAWYSASWLLELRNSFDVVNRYWTQAIVQFNALRQKSLLAPIGIDSADQRQLLLALVSVFAAILLAATAWVLRSGAAAHGDALDKAWQRFCRSFARRGLRIRSDEGPLDFLARSAGLLPDGPCRDRAHQLVDEYIRLRYGVVTPAQADVQLFARKVGEFRLPRVVKESA